MDDKRVHLFTFNNIYGGAKIIIALIRLLSIFGLYCLSRLSDSQIVTNP